MEQTEQLMNPELWRQAYVVGAEFGLKLVAALLILVVGRWVAQWLAGLSRRLMERAGTDATLVGFARNLIYFALLTFVVIAAIGQLGVQTTSFIAVLGAAGFAVGLALQGSLANFAAGVLMIVFRPFKAGDYVEVAGTAGTVESIQVFTTQLKTPDNKTIIIPNGQITSGTIVNYSAKDTRRVDMTFGIGYGDDIDKAKGVIRDVLGADPRVLPEPAPVIAVVALADSSVNIVARPWVKSSDYWGVLTDTHENIKKQFDAQGISIPFPQRDVHLYKAD
ncbi:MAG: mechanosensitive ion channel [Burkholderiales bacterium]|nr:MAG: mechanosensitive ion channel [Burkholderiales bacterium]